MPRSARAKFFSRVVRASDCWEWTGTHTVAGYPVFYYGRRQGKSIRLYAHRLVHYIITGEWPEVVMHVCDNPGCVNPAHLRGGTIADNNRDMMQKGRHASQKQTHCLHGHELTPDNVRYMARKTGKKQRRCLTCDRKDQRRRYRREFPIVQRVRPFLGDEYV